MTGWSCMNISQFHIIGKARVAHGNELEIDAERFGGGFLIGPFVDDILTAKIDTKAFGRSASAPRKRRDDSRVDATAEEATNRHVAHELRANDLSTARAPLIDVHFRRSDSAAKSDERPVSVSPGAASIDLEILTGPQLADAAKECPLEQWRVKVQVLI